MCENTIMLDRLEINKQVIDDCNREHPTALIKNRPIDCNTSDTQPTTISSTPEGPLNTNG